MRFRFLHLADLHLETHFGGRAGTRERLRRATLEAFVRAVDLALDRKLHAVLVAGDLYDDPLLSPRAELELVRQVTRLTEAGIWFLWVCGNHDPGGPSKRSGELGLEGRERVHVFRRRSPESVVVTDPDGNEVGVVVGAGHPSEREEANIAAAFSPQHTQLPVVGLLHTQVESARSAESHARYAPCEPRDLERQGYAYWALGHVHLRQRAAPGLPAFYCGNLQGRNPRETGAKGGLLVEAEPGVPAEPSFVPFAPVRWECTHVQGLADLQSLAALTDHLAEHLDTLHSGIAEELAVRIELAGPTRFAGLLRSEERRDALEEELAARCGLLEVQLRDKGLRIPRNVEEIAASPSVLAMALAMLRSAGNDEQLLASCAPEMLAGIFELEGREDWTELSAEEKDAQRLVYLRSLLEGLEEELLERCLAEEDA